jgi:hypothetical protein
MRGEDGKQEGMFSYVSPEKRVPPDHALRLVREMVDGILKEMSPRFAGLYSDRGRPSIAPERLLRALLLQVFYSVRSERMLMEQLDYNPLFRWFVGMEMDERDAALLMASKIPGTQPITLGGDKNYDTRDFVDTLREMKITPHVARNEKRLGGSTIEARTTRHSGYEISLQKRKRVEQSFGRMKMIGLLRKVKFRGIR